VYYLLTDKTAGAGGVISSDLIETVDFANTATFLEQNKLFFDGALASPVNLRQFIADTAPYFLCSFVISNGKFSLVPAVPHNTAGAIVNTPVQIAALFTSGNIVEGTFTVDYLQTEERKDFQAIVRYRKEKKNQLPEEATLSVRWAEAGSDTHPIESFDLTQFCTTRDHAFLVARYFMSLRRRVTHSVRFKTTPYGISLAPGNYIRVLTEASPYQPANNGVIDADGDITSATTLADGNYTIVYYTSSNEEVQTATLTVASGKAVQPSLFNTIFTLNNPTVSSSTYVIEQLTLDEEGLVEILATEFATTNTYNSLIAQDILSLGSFITEG
jgi:predicted phage tail protein